MRRLGPITVGVLAVVALASNGAAYAAAPHAALVLASIGWTFAGAASLVGLYAGLPRTASDFRRPWKLLLAGSVCWLLGQLAWDGYVVAGATPPIPSVGDIGWLLFALFALLACVGLFRFDQSVGAAQRIVLLDAAAVVVASSTLLVALLHREVSDAHVSLATKAVAVAYPILYCAVALVLVESIGRQPFVLRLPGVSLILAGAAIEAAAFTWWSTELLHGSYRPGHGGIDILWTLGEIAIGAGGLLAAGRDLPARARRQSLQYRSPVPGFAFVALLLVLCVGTLSDWDATTRVSLRIGLLATGLAVFARTWTVSKLWEHTLARERSIRATLQRTNRELEAFSYTASHDLKAPLVSIQGFADSLRRRADGTLDERSQLYLSRIQSNASSMQELIDELLEFARAGSLDGERVPTDADTIAREVVQSFRERDAERAANLELVTRLPQVDAHPVQFRQALTNLIENALEHAGGDAPRVRVGAVVEGSTVAIVVEDDGRGVAANDEPRIFDLFARGGSEETGRTRGIGLALVKKVAESSGGTVRYEPGPRGGSRFVLSLRRGAVS